MKEGLLNYKTSQISYHQFGSGPKLVLCFHGYGEEAASFDFLDVYAGKEFTFLAIDLPFHGKTQWDKSLPLANSDLMQIIEDLLEENNRKLQTTNHAQHPADKLVLLGFSLGGRIALSLYQAMPGQIEKLILLAPDGLKANFWYWLATQTWLGKNLFAITMKHPGWFFAPLRLLNKLGLVNASIFKFVIYYIEDKEARMLLYNRWITLRKIKSSNTPIKSFIKQYKTPVRLVYGKHDRIILSSVGEKFRKGIEDQCSITVIHAGHQVLHEKHMSEILPILFD